MNNLDFLRINWTFNQYGKTTAPANIELSVTKRKDRYAFIFRNGVGEALGEYAVVGSFGELLAFRKCEKGEGGYKLSKRSKNDNYKELSVAIKYSGGQYDPFIGDYKKLLYNPDRKEFYVLKGGKV